jgi:hypothetical protein
MLKRKGVRVKALVKNYEVVSCSDLVSFMVSHSNADEINAIVDDIVETNKWTVDGNNFATLVSMETFLLGVLKWAKQQTHSVMWTNNVASLELAVSQEFNTEGRTMFPLVDIGGVL